MIKTGKELAAAALNVAKNYKTLYVMGCFGAPLTGGNVTRYCNNHSYNKQGHRTMMIKARANKTPPYFGFDCVCLIKGLLWGWNGSEKETYGGATYTCNGVPDIDADAMIKVCTDVSENFSKIEVGEVVWEPGHIGIYIGDGLAVECTPQWANGVQITSCNRAISGRHRRNWTKHGKLPYVEYPVENVEKPTEKTIEELACEVLEGKHGNGADREKALGDKYAAVQARVNEILSGKVVPEKTIDELAREVIAGKHGNGADRKKALGDKYAAVQARVNELLK